MQMKPIIPFEPQSKEHIPLGAEWIYQIKWDGVRILAYAAHGTVHLYNRKLKKRTYHYPELTETPFIQADSFITDGEVIALAEDGLPSFHEVMRRDGIRRMERVQEVRRIVPIYYMIFDLLYIDGQWITHLPLRDRLMQLEERILPDRQIAFVTSETNGPALFKAIQERKMEGIVCKKIDSTYGIAQKDARWVKIKNYGDVIAVIGGYTLNGGIVNALLLGLYDDEGKFHFIGKVGTGKLTVEDWRDLTESLNNITIDHCPFTEKIPGQHEEKWVKPVITVKVQYSEWRKNEGRLLRQPSIQHLVDIPAKECKFDD